MTPSSSEESEVSKQLLRIRIDAIRREDTEASQAAKEALGLLETWQKSHGKETFAEKIRRAGREAVNRLVRAGAIDEMVPSMSIPELIQNLNRENYVASHVATEIGKRGVREGIEPLVEALYRQDIRDNIEPMVRALESIDRAQAAQLLQAGLQNSDFANKQGRLLSWV